MVYEYGESSARPTKAQKERAERNRKQALLRRAGYRDWNEAVRDVRAPSRPYCRNRPALQVLVFTWASNRQPVTFVSMGSVYLLTNFNRGDQDNQRHSAETLMYKMLIKMRLYTDKTQWTRCIKYKMYWWLVYDAAPVGQMPECSTIFETFIDGMPGLWLVNRDMAHRFIVKKHWSVVMIVTGCDVSVDLPNGRSAVPAHVFVDSSKFYKKLGVRIEWKGGTTGGQIGDIKKGALYLVGAPSYDFKVQVSAKFRVYFKSVGNQ